MLIQFNSQEHILKSLFHLWLSKLQSWNTHALGHGNLRGPPPQEIAGPNSRPY